MTAGMVGARQAMRVVVSAVAMASCAGASTTVTPTCAPGAVAEAGSCRVFAVRSVERIPTPWAESGRSLTLEMVQYRPLRAGPYPTVIFHHGSTGNGDNPSLFRQTFTSESVARVLAELGWMVLFPQRRGRGASDGQYDEGFVPDRSRYACTASLATASYRGTLNFVGGWIGEGCPDASLVNRGSFVAAAPSTIPSLWLYGENDPFYSSAHSRANFEAYQAAGGRGSFRLYRRGSAEASGHFIQNEPVLWASELRAWLDQIAR